MSEAGTVTLDYEQQAEQDGTNRACGAACLSMVYRSFAKEISQAQIWPAISKPNRFGSLASTTHLMARDALSRGLVAIAIQTRHPLLALRLCRDSGIRAILNHRLKLDQPTGHYTVLVDIDDKSVVLHDPFLGPARRLSHAELMELWQPRFPTAEIVGNVLIGITAEPGPALACPLCRTPIPAQVTCPNCHEAVALRPGALLACVNSSCIARMWNYLCCPSCDYTWTFGIEGSPLPVGLAGVPDGPSATVVAASPASNPPAPSEKESGHVAQIFAELDKFTKLILASPAAAHPDVKAQLDFIAASKGKLKLAIAEELLQRKAAQDQLAKMGAAAQTKQDAHRKKLEDLGRPLAPIDATALTRALLKNLGLIE